MPAFNFSERFAPEVAAFRKMNTIRQTQRAKPGDIAHLYTDLRTKKVKKLGEGICTEVYAVAIHSDKLVTRHGPDSVSYNNPTALDTFAQRDGFKDWAEMCSWFKEKYGLPFHGWFHAWRPKS